MIETRRYIISRLSTCYSPSEARELAWWILEESTGLNRTEILCGCKDTKKIPNLEIILQELCQKKPIQYIFGHTLWKNLDLKLSPATLIPRPETAELVDHLLAATASCARQPLRVLDIGTGSGCIALALKQARPDWQVSGLDISAEAIAIAQQNAIRNQLDVHFFQADIFTDEIGSFDLIVSNPPYICESERSEMSSTVLDYEPATALFVPDADPLRYYRRIAALKAAPRLFFEINEAYGEATCSLLASLDYTDILLTYDQFRKARIVSGRIAQ